MREEMEAQIKHNEQLAAQVWPSVFLKLVSLIHTVDVKRGNKSWSAGNDSFKEPTQVNSDSVSKFWNIFGKQKGYYNIIAQGLGE